MRNTGKMIFVLLVCVGLVAGSFAVAAAKGPAAETLTGTAISFSAIDVRMAIVCAAVAAAVGIAVVVRRRGKVIMKKTGRGAHERFVQKRNVEYLDT